MTKMKFILILVSIFLGSCYAQSNRSPKAKGSRYGQLQRRVSAMEEQLKDVEKQLKTSLMTTKELQQTVRDLKSAASPVFPRPDKHNQKLQDFPDCPNKVPGFHHVPEFNACLKLLDRETLVNWTEGVRLCKELDSNAHIVSVENPRQHEVITNIWMTERGIASLSRFWTSGRRYNGKWRWEASSITPIGWTYWIPTTSHDDDRFSCLAVYSNEAYNWGDVACWAPHQITCQIPL